MSIAATGTCGMTLGESWSSRVERGSQAFVGDTGETDGWGELMRAAQDGDGASYARLLAEISPLLRRTVRRRWSAQTAEIEDIVQEVLLSVHSARHTYDPARPFLPWLMAIVQYRVADAGRRQARRNANEQPECSFEYGLPEVPQDAPTEPPGDPQALRRAIAELPAGQRRAVELLKLQERSLKEAAAETGMSVAALKVAVHRGIKALRVTLVGRE